MSNTPVAGITELPANSAQPHVFVNAGTRALEVLATLAVLSSTETDPPTVPVEGDAYIVPADATGEWETHVGEVAYYSGGWKYLQPRTGWRAYAIDTTTDLRATAGAPATWEEIAGGGGGGGSGIDISDGTTTVAGATSLVFTGATVTDLGGDSAGVEVEAGGGGAPAWTVATDAMTSPHSIYVDHELTRCDRSAHSTLGDPIYFRDDADRISALGSELPIGAMGAIRVVATFTGHVDGEPCVLFSTPGSVVLNLPEGADLYGSSPYIAKVGGVVWWMKVAADTYDLWGDLAMT